MCSLWPRYFSIQYIMYIYLVNVIFNLIFKNIKIQWLDCRKQLRIAKNREFHVLKRVTRISTNIQLFSTLAFKILLVLGAMVSNNYLFFSGSIINLEEVGLHYNSRYPSVQLYLIFFFVKFPLIYVHLLCKFFVCIFFVGQATF